MDLATLEYLKDTEQLERVDLYTSGEVFSLDTMYRRGYDLGYELPTGSVRDLLLARGGSITRQEYDAFKRGVNDGQAQYWAEKQTLSTATTGER